MSKVYSLDEENFTYAELADAVAIGWDDCGAETAAEAVGRIVTVFEGETSPYDPTNWVPDIVEGMENAASDEAGEWADDWCGASKEQSAELQTEVEKVVAAWLTKHSLGPTFYSVINVRKVQCRITSETGDYEIVEGAAP